MISYAIAASLLGLCLGAPLEAASNCVDGVDNVITVTDNGNPAFDDFKFNNVQIRTYSDAKLSVPSCTVGAKGHKSALMNVPGYFQLARQGSIRVPHNVAGLKNMRVLYSAAHNGRQICSAGNLVFDGINIDGICSQAFCPAFGGAACNYLFARPGQTVNVADLPSDAFNVGSATLGNIPAELRVILEKILGEVADGVLSGSGLLKAMDGKGRSVGGGSNAGVHIHVSTN